MDISWITGFLNFILSNGMNILGMIIGWIMKAVSYFISWISNLGWFGKILMILTIIIIFLIINNFPKIKESQRARKNWDRP